MKKNLKLLTVGILAMGMVAGSLWLLNNIKRENNTKKYSVISTSFPGYDFARAIVGKNTDIEAKMLLKPGGESHTYEPTPKEIEDIKKSNMFIYVGGDSDEWVKKVLKEVDTKKTKVVKLVDLVKTKAEEIVEGMEEEKGEYHSHVDSDSHNHDHKHSHNHEKESEHDHDNDERVHKGNGYDHEGNGHHHDENNKHDHDEDNGHSHDKNGSDHREEKDKHGHDEDGDSHKKSEKNHKDAEKNDEVVQISKEEREIDEHVWTSPKNAKEIVNKILVQMIEFNKEEEKKLTANAKDYISKLEQVDRKFQEIVVKAKRKEIIVADRFPLRYFVDEYGLKYSAVFPGCSEQTEASAKTISYIVEKIKKEKNPVIFKIELSNGLVAEAVAKETGAKIEEFHSAHNISEKDFVAGITYVNLMERNAERLQQALN